MTIELCRGARMWCGFRCWCSALVSMSRFSETKSLLLKSFDTSCDNDDDLLINAVTHRFDV